MKTIFIRGMRNDCLDTLNLLGKGDISQESFDEKIKICLRCSRGSSRGRVMVWDASVKIQKSTNEGVIRAEIINLFKNLKTDLLSTLSAQIMMTQVKKAQDEVDTNSVVFCLKCMEKHSLKECRVNIINLYNICDLEHSTGHCPELPRLKAMLKESSKEVQSSYFIGSRKPWKPRPPTMSQGLSSFNQWNNTFNTQQFSWKYSTPSPS